MARTGGFNERSARRISRAVIAYERGDQSASATKVAKGGDDFEPVRLGKTTEAWPKGTLADVELYEGGSPGSEAKASPVLKLKGCVNKFADVETGRWVMLALAMNGSYYLIAAEC